MHFTKMHGAGNDYVYVDCTKETVENPSEVAKLVSDRHFGIGADGLILIKPSEKADVTMEMYNADGSRGEMCGNGIRCVGKFVYDKGLTDQTQIAVESFGKIKYLTLYPENGAVKRVRVNMGPAILEAEQVPVLYDEEETRVLTLEDGSTIKHAVVDAPLEIGEEVGRVTCVSMGNPHAVLFVDDTESLPLEQIGPAYENHRRFPNRINTEFVQVIDRGHVRMRVWERGSGETLACGTGCCATGVACVLNGKTDDRILVDVLGGQLEIEWDKENNSVWMTGPARTVFEGTVDTEL
jgi:diaminopimelate epimerase